MGYRVETPSEFLVRIRLILAGIPRETLKAVFLELMERLQKCVQVDREYPGVPWIGKEVSKSATTTLSNRKTLRNLRFYFVRIAKTRPSKKIIFRNSHPETIFLN
jgi:hypothetical protein